MAGRSGFMEAIDYVQKLGLDLTKQVVEIPNANRVTLAEMFGQLGYTRGVEIGTEQGVYAEVLCQKNPNLHLTCVDAWGAYRGYRDHVSQDKLDRFFETTKERLSPYNTTLIRKYSMDAVGDFEDGSLDFVYIDANHELPFVVNDIIHWAKKVRKGGVVSGHDYYKSTKYDSKCHVVYAVDAYVASYRIRPLYLLGRKERIEGELRDTSRSWMFIKP